MTDKQKTTGSTIGIIDGNEKIINLKKNIKVILYSKINQLVEHFYLVQKLKL